MIINFLKNPLNNEDSFNQGISALKTALASINFPVSIKITPINQTFTGVNIGNPAVGMNAEGVNPNEILALVSGQDDVAFLIYQTSQVTPSTTNPCMSYVKKGKTVPAQMSEQWYNDMPDVFCEFVLHELCHTLYFFTNQTANDYTHQKYNETLWNHKFDQLSNDAYYLYLINYLAPLYLGQNATLQATLTRNLDNGVETLGTLDLPNFECRTLELSYKGNKPNISAIPPGQYLCKWQFMARELSYHYCLQNVPNRTGIFIHSGSYFFDTKGCIILGSLPQVIPGSPQPSLLNTKTILANFERLLAKQDFTLTIK